MDIEYFFVLKLREGLTICQIDVMMIMITGRTYQLKPKKLASFLSEDAERRSFQINTCHNKLFSHKKSISLCSQNVA